MCIFNIGLKIGLKLGLKSEKMWVMRKIGKSDKKTGGKRQKYFFFLLKNIHKISNLTKFHEQIPILGEIRAI